MSTSAANVGRATVVFESASTQVDPSLLANRGPADVEEGKVADAYAQLKGILQDVADDFGDALASRAGKGLSSVAVEFALTFSTEANVWVVRAGGQGSVTATLTWDLHQADGPGASAVSP
jgi:hypothetical protein